MKIETDMISVLMVLFVPIVSLYAQTPPHPDQLAPRTVVMVVGGISNDPDQRLAKDKVETSLQTLLTTSVPSTTLRLRFFVDSKAYLSNNVRKSTKAEIQKEFEQLTGEIRPVDRFVFYYVGQANIAASELRLNLPGPDMTHPELVQLLASIPAEDQVIILDCPGAGLAVKELSRSHRILLCGARSDQPYSTHFSEYFVPALSDMNNDSDQNGKISLLEAFQKAAMQVDDYYRQQELMATEVPLLEDNGDGTASEQPWRYLETHNDGAKAADWYLFGK